MTRYKVKRGDFMAMSTIASNLSKEEAELVASIENKFTDNYTIVDIEKYDVPFKFGR